MQAQLDTREILASTYGRHLNADSFLSPDSLSASPGSFLGALFWEPSGEWGMGFQGSVQSK